MARVARPTTLDQLIAPAVTPEILRFRAKYWRVYADRFERYGRQDQAARLRTNCRAMEQQAAQIERGPIVPVVQAAPATVARKPRPARASAVLKAEQFWRLHAQAVAAIVAAHGPQWACTAPIDEMVLTAIPANLRSYKTARGAIIRFRADHRIPAAHWWPEGRFPAELPTEVDYPRETKRSEWKKRGQPDSFNIGYHEWEIAWAKRNNLVRSGQIWIKASEQINAAAA